MVKSFKDVLNESSLSRLWLKNGEYDCAIISAFRSHHDCGNGEKIVHSENQKRNRSLKSDIEGHHYEITNIFGAYKEGGKIVREASFFVCNVNDDDRFERNIISLGEKYEQDGILMCPKGALQNNSQAYLYGTNHCPKSFPKWHEKKLFEKGLMGHLADMHTYIDGRPFIFIMGDD